MQKTFSVPGMHCGHCKSAVTEELEKVDAVEAVAVDLDARTVTVSGPELDGPAIVAAIDEAGYEAEEIAT